MDKVTDVEPWLRGTLGDVDAVRRQVLHALELSVEDVNRWCVGLTDEEREVTAFGLPSVEQQMRHMVRSLDRLLTYAEGRQLEQAQMEALRTEHESDGVAVTMTEFRSGMEAAVARIRALPGGYEERREVGKKRLPSTLGGLLVHCAEHMQRHAGQMVTTAKVVVGLRADGA